MCVLGSVKLCFNSASVLVSRNVTDFPKFLGIAMETFLVMCDDKESDVRMAADECLNRIIKVRHARELAVFVLYRNPPKKTHLFAQKITS